MSFLKNLQRLEAEGKRGGEIKTFVEEWCAIHLIPLNRTTLKFYERLDEKNREEWNKVEEVENV